MTDQVNEPTPAELQQKLAEMLMTLQSCTDPKLRKNLLSHVRVGLNELDRLVRGAVKFHLAQLEAKDSEKSRER